MIGHHRVTIAPLSELPDLQYLLHPHHDRRRGECSRLIRRMISGYQPNIEGYINMSLLFHNLLAPPLNEHTSSISSDIHLPSPAHRFQIKPLTQPAKAGVADNRSKGHCSPPFCQLTGTNQ